MELFPTRVLIFPFVVETSTHPVVQVHARERDVGKGCGRIEGSVEGGCSEERTNIAEQECANSNALQSSYGPRVS